MGGISRRYITAYSCIYLAGKARNKEFKAMNKYNRKPLNPQNHNYDCNYITWSHHTCTGGRLPAPDESMTAVLCQHVKLKNYKKVKKHNQINRLLKDTHIQFIIIIKLGDRVVT